MRTWTLNVEELLLLVHSTKLAKLLQHPTNVKKHVGLCAVALSLTKLKKKKVDVPIDPQDFGVIDFMTTRGKTITLVPEEGAKEHPDGKKGEVFLRTFSSRKKIKDSLMPRKCTCLRIVVCSFLSHQPLPVVTGSSGWWDKNEIYLLPQKGLIIAGTFIVQSATYVGNSANVVNEWADNYTCVITGRKAFPLFIYYSFYIC